MVNKDVFLTSEGSTPLVAEKQPVVSTQSDDAIKVIDQKISYLNNALREITSLEDVEKHFPGLKEFYAKLLADRRKRRNLKKKQNKTRKLIKVQQGLDVKSKDFTKDLMKVLKLSFKDLDKPLIEVQNLSGADLVSANFYNRGILEEALYTKSQKGFNEKKPS